MKTDLLYISFMIYSNLLNCNNIGVNFFSFIFFIFDLYSMTFFYFLLIPLFFLICFWLIPYLFDKADEGNVFASGIIWVCLIIGVPLALLSQCVLCYLSVCYVISVCAMLYQRVLCHLSVCYDI